MLPFGAAVTYIYLHRGFLEELLPRLLILSICGALTCVPEGGEFQLTVGEMKWKPWLADGLMKQRPRRERIKILKLLSYQNRTLPDKILKIKNGRLNNIAIFTRPNTELCYSFLYPFSLLLLL